MKSTLYFFGGAGAVTGSNFMLESESQKILIDCGLFQGCNFCEDANYKAFPFEPKEISVLLVTHAHIDHIGRIPKLVKDGFKGKIISTKATKALAAELLRDSMELLGREAEKLDRKPLYDEEDVMAALSVWDTVYYHEDIQLQDGFTVRLLDAGHILGSAMVELRRQNEKGEMRKLVLTGDLGNDSSLLVGPTEVLSDVQYLVMESVYGDKVHEGIEDRTERLEDIIENTMARGGTLLIPAFSTERTQDLLFEIRELMVQKRIPSVPVFVDSPLALRVTEAFSANPDYFRDSIRERILGGEDIFKFPQLQFTHTPDESKALHAILGPKIIIAGSGMSQGGRILSHEKEYLADPNSTLLIVGYQPAGSLGRRLLEGEKEVVIFKEKVKVRARVLALYGYSAHRDSEGLVSFVHEATGAFEKIFVTMGEPKSSLFLVQRLRDFLGLQATAPLASEKAELNL